MEGHKFLKVTGILMIMPRYFPSLRACLSADWERWRQDSARHQD